jgi:hypothetical protein
MCAISGYGQHSVWAHRAGHDINYVAMSGVLEQLATVGGEVITPNFQIGDLMGGTQAAVGGILAGLLGVQRHGVGCFVDVSMTHEVLGGGRLDSLGLASRAERAGKSRRDPPRLADDAQPRLGSAAIGSRPGDLIQPSPTRKVPHVSQAKQDHHYLRRHRRHSHAVDVALPAGYARRDCRSRHRRSPGRRVHRSPACARPA